MCSVLDPWLWISTSGFHVCPSVPRGLSHITAAELVGSYQASPWHTEPNRRAGAWCHWESNTLSPKPVPRSAIWQPSQPRGCHLAKQVLETPAEKIAAIRSWIVTRLTNKGTKQGPGSWARGELPTQPTWEKRLGKAKVGEIAREEPWQRVMAN